jgi:hypothetical protein
MADVGEKVPAEISMKGVTLPAGTRVTMPGSNTPCRWHNSTDSFTLSIPTALRNRPPSDYVWVFKAEF